MEKEITMIELFSGIGAQERGLKSLGIPYKVVATSDIDKNSIVSYAAMRNDIESKMKSFDFPTKDAMVAYLQSKNVGFDFKTMKHTITQKTKDEDVKLYYLCDRLSNNLGDVSKISSLPYADILTYSFPCTDVSVAGKCEGLVNKCECGYSWEIDFNDDKTALVCPKCGKTVQRSTHSGLLGQVQRLMAAYYKNGEMPKYLLLENVKNLVGQKFKAQFDSWLKWLDSIGYNTYWKVMNAKKYGIPQNRERVFAVSIRKDIDTHGFTFPQEVKLNTRLCDILENHVDEKYYLPDEKVKDILESLMKRMGNPNEAFICASRGRNPENPSDRTAGVHTEQRLEANTNGTSNVLTTVTKDNLVCEPQILRAERTEYGKQIRKQYEAGEIEEKIKNMRELSPRNDDISNTITTVQKDNLLLEPKVAECIGGIGEKKSNGGTQYFQQDRIYCGDVALAHPAGIPGGSYKYVVAEPEIDFVGGIGDKDRVGDGKKLSRNYSQGERVYNSEGISTTLMASNVGGDAGPTSLYAVYDDYNGRFTKDEKVIGTLTTNCGQMARRTGTKVCVVDATYAMREPRIYNEISPTLRTNCGNFKCGECYYTWRVRRLTPKECFRLMGFSDGDADNAAKYVSESARYSQCGNSIVVSCLTAIFASLLLENGDVTWVNYANLFLQ